MKQEWFKIYVTCIKESKYNVTMKLNEKIELGRFTAKGLCYAVLDTLKQIYKPEFYKITIEE